MNAIIILLAGPLVGVILGFALAKASDWWASRPKLAVYPLRARALYAAIGAAMQRRRWTVCDRDDQRAQALIVLNLMVQNVSSHDDAVMQIRAAVPGFQGREFEAKASDVEDFLATSVATHSIVQLRVVFEVPRQELPTAVWDSLQAARLKLKVATIRGEVKVVDISLAEAFQPPPILDPNGTPPIRGYTEIRTSMRPTTPTFLGPQAIYEEYDLW